MAIKVAVPGKLMLMGEHGAVYGYPCLVAAVNQYLTVAVTKTDAQSDIFITPDVKDSSFIKKSLEKFREKYHFYDRVRVTTKSDIGSFGLGSSAAVTVGLVKSLTEVFKINISDRDLFNLCFDIILNVQNRASGFDTAACIYGGLLYYQNKGKIIEKLDVGKLPIVVGYSGSKALTVKLVDQVYEKWNLHKEAVDKIFENIAGLVVQAKKALLEKDWVKLGKFFNCNQNYLEDLGVSSGKLNTMIKAARSAGAYGAKLSGAGGGDCMIALIDGKIKKKVEQAIESKGGIILNLETNADRVSIISK